MLKIRAEAHAGADLRDEMLPDMLALAQRTLCQVEVEANETKFWAYPTDTIGRLKDAYDRLYPESRLVSTPVLQPLPRVKS